MTAQRQETMVSVESGQLDLRSRSMNESVLPAEDLDRDVMETRAVREWRAEQLRGLGLPAILAETFADHIDWHALSALIERGCPLGLALEIVR
jgi:hypothetical protein